MRDYELLNLSASSYKLLQLIAQNKSLEKKDIIRMLPVDFKEEEIEDSLSYLKGSELIKEKKSFIDEFDTFYITSKGLEINRKIS